jgi:Holliday junction resolvase RusA-like endonuclease
MYTPQKTADYEAKIREEGEKVMRGCGRIALQGPLQIDLTITLGIPASYSKKRTEACLRGFEMPTKVPDWDNVAKAVCDALNGVVWIDDKQVVDAVVRKRYGDEPCIIAIVTPLDLGSNHE